MKNSQKGFIVPLLIIVIAVLALGGGVYVYQKNKAPDKSNANTNVQLTPNNDKPITVLSPNGGESFKTGDAIDIHWRSTIKGPHIININLQRTDETQTIRVVNDLEEKISPETGTSKYTWIVPANISGSFVVRVSSPDVRGEDNIDNTIMDRSDASFTIISSSQSAGLKTYTNTEFSIQYPTSFSLAPGRKIGSAFTEQDVAQYIKLRTTGNKYSGGSFFIFSAESSSAISNCLKAPASLETEVSSIGTTTINGTQFLSFQAFSPATGQFRRWQEYHALYNGQCYIISGQIDGEQPSHISDPTQKKIAETEISNLQSLLDSVAKTFRFTK